MNMNEYERRLIHRDVTPGRTRGRASDHGRVSRLVITLYSSMLLVPTRPLAI